MLRRSLLPCVCLAVALGTALLIAAPPARSQDRSTQERLDRLERDLNMLQRQVYRGAPPPPIGADGGAAVNAEIRMDRLESQMRDLTGHVEEVTNQIAQLRQRVEQINSDVEVRFGQLGAGPVAPASGNPAIEAADAAPAGRSRPPPPVGATEDELRTPRFSSAAGSGAPMRPGTAVPPPGDAAPVGLAPTFGTLTPPGSPARAPELTSAAPAGRPPAVGMLPSGSATDQYNQAFGLLKKANYAAAEAAFKAFLEQHPRDPMAGNAQYWLGETYYTRAKYIEAASAFAEGYKRYPKGAKAADGLLKLGMSLARANQKQNACLAFAQLDHDFPNPGAAIKQHAAAERKRLGC